VTVCEGANGEITLLYEGRELPYTTYRKGEKPPPVADEKTVNEHVDAALAKQDKARAQPTADDPWRTAGTIAVAKAAARSPTTPNAP